MSDSVIDVRLRSGIDVELIQHCGNDSVIASAAMVCTRGELCDSGVSVEKTEGLIGYLMKHRHGTPFEHGCMTFFVRAPIFVWREWHRHRIGFGYNEESGRYSTLKPEFYIPEYNRPMMKVDDWRPGRPKFLTLDESLPSPLPGIMSGQAIHVYNELYDNLKKCYEISYKSYLDNLLMGIDPGLARDCLPVGIYSSCWVTCNPRSLMAFLSLRTHEPDAKFVSYPLYEIEEAARKCEKIFSEIWPITHQAFCENGRVSP